MKTRFGGLVALLVLVAACKDDKGEGNGSIDSDGDGTPDDQDCEPDDAGVHPDADEVCDSRDNDCDGEIDEDAVDAGTWYADGDADGFGDAASPVAACDQPAGHTADATDCDDSISSVNPDATEVFNGRDDDCDILIDDDDESLDTSTWETAYQDLDGDGYGTDQATVQACSPPDGYADLDGDCDDDVAEVSPGAVEVCNGMDDDCDDLVDQDDPNIDTNTLDMWYADADGDGFGDPDTEVLSCEQPEGLIDDGNDCDDDDAWTWPGAPEVCGDGVLNNCDASGDPDPGCWGTVELSEADLVLLGVAEDDEAGAAVAGVGDWDGDGYEDLVVGAPGDDTTAEDAGAVYVVLGGTTGRLSLAHADARFLGEGAFEYAGRALARAGDVDGDGLVDLLVGAPLHETGGTYAGAAYLLPGGSLDDDLLCLPGTFIPGDTEGSWAGISVAGAGDFDGDGFDDLVVGAYQRAVAGSAAGGASVLLGRDDLPTSLPEPDLQLVGDAVDDWAGYAVGGGGDLDGDGLDDVLVGAPQEGGGTTYTGAAYVVLGGVTGTSSLAHAGYKLTAQAPNDYAGWSVAVVGDADGDGHDDALVGAHFQDAAGAESGAVYFVAGPVTAAMDLGSAPLVLTGQAESDLAGWAVGSAGDVDADGLPELLVGATGHASHGVYAGAAYVFDGGFTGVQDLGIGQGVMLGQSPGDRAGGAVAGMVDLDGDGKHDVIVGAPGVDQAADRAGAAYAVFAR